MERNDDINPFWIEDRELKKGPVAFMSSAENLFWKDLLEKYLFPIDEDKNEKVIERFNIIKFCIVYSTVLTILCKS